MRLWLANRTLPARRLLSYRRDRRSGAQMCKVCGRAQTEVGFITCDRTWEAVVPARWRRWAMCLDCFDRFAAERGIHVVKVFLANP